MNKTIVTVALFLLSVRGYGQQEHTRLNLGSGKVVPGNLITLDYDAQGSDLEFSDEVRAAIFSFDNNGWHTDTASMTKASKHWSASYKVPANARFLAFKFYQGNFAQPDAIDINERQGFYRPVKDSRGNTLQGAAIAEAQLFMPQEASNSIYNYFGSDISEKASYALHLLEGERKRKDSNIFNFLPFYLRVKTKALGEDKARAEGIDLINKLLASPGLNDQRLAILSRAASFNLKSANLANQINSRILRQYPSGSEARFVVFSNIKKTDPDAHVRIASYEDFLRQYPVSEWRKNNDGKGFMYYETFRSLGSSYYETKQYDKFIALFKQMEFRSGNEVWRWNLTRGQMMDEMQHGKAADTLLQLAEATIPYLIKLKNDGSYREDFDSPQMAQENADKQLDDRLFTLISLQSKTKNYKRAAESFRYLSKKGLYSNADLNELHLNVLEKLDDNKSILPLLEMSARENALTPRMINKLKEIYNANNPENIAGYDKYFRSLASADGNAELRASVQANMVNFPYKSFELEDANGNIVNSADWKDKIVIIDFWATWCRPCIMAFPGMQLVVDKYANDPQVLVYFIGTMQNGDYKAKSTQYVKNAGFRFNLLHDAVNPGNGQQDVVFKSMVPFFNSSAIPRKIIVQNGIIKYTAEGYSGSPSKLLDELSMAVDIIKTKK